MENINIITTQNVFLYHKIANVGERISATIIDILIFIAYIYIYFLVSYVYGSQNSSLVLYMFIIPFALYHPISEIFMNGQSLGKKAIGIKVVKIDGSQPSIGSFIIRWIFRIIDVDLFSGLIAIIVISSNGKGQRIGDIIAKTTVINIRKKESLENTIHKEIAKNYELAYPQVDLLNDSDLNTIKDVILLYKKDMSSNISSDLVYKTASAVSKKMGIGYNKSPYEFLEKVITDYNYIHKSYKLL